MKITVTDDAAKKITNVIQMILAQFYCLILMMVLVPYQKL